MEKNAGGQEIEILAPGDQIVSASCLGGVIVTEGTSGAAAHVTGAAALLWSKDKSKSADFVRRLIAGTAQEVANASGSSGLLDITNCVENYIKFAENYGVNSKDVLEFKERRETAQKFETELVNGQWKTSTDHPALAEGAIKFNTISISANNLKLLLVAAQLPDDKNYSEARMLHGSNNYMLTLHFLYRCAAYVRSGKSNDQAIALAASDSQINDLASDAGAVKLLKSKMSKLLSSNICTGITETSNGARYYKVVGFAMHFLGDLFAHRTIVPLYTVQGTNPANHTNKMFGTTDFHTGAHTVMPDATLKQWCSKPTTDICKHWKCFQRSVQLGVVEFRDIKEFSVKSTTGIYEDNKNFCSERYEEAVDACDIFLLHSYQKDVYDGIDIIWPANGSILNGFKTLSRKAKEPYYNDADYDTTFWNKASTNELV